VGRAKRFFVAEARRRLKVDALDEEAHRALVVAAEAARALLRDTPAAGAIERGFRALLDLAMSQSSDGLKKSP
jgi:hypothetical protein